MTGFEFEQEKSRKLVAEYLRQMADGLEQGNKLTFVFDDESATVTPPENLYFRLETDRDSSWLAGDDGRSLVLELGWEAEDVETDGDLTIVTQPNTQTRIPEAETD